MTKNDYARYERMQAGRQSAHMRPYLALGSPARMRSLLVRSRGAFVRRDTAIRRNKLAARDGGEWVEHVRDGQPLTERGAELLSQFSAKGERMSKREPHMRPPTKPEFLLGAVQIQDDVSWYNWRDDAVRQGYGSFEADYETLCEQAFGFVPDRIHNLGPNNIWGLPAGPECCWPENLGSLPPGPFTQPQIEAFNACVPKETIVAWNAVDPVPQPAKPGAA